jgi:hypothetical protein
MGAPFEAAGSAVHGRLAHVPLPAEIAKGLRGQQQDCRFRWATLNVANALKLAAQKLV